jgi:hypothetical protein
VPRHLLHCGQIDAQVEQVPDPGPAQVVRCRGLDLGLATTLAADLPGRCWAEAGQAFVEADQAAGLEHCAEERAGFLGASYRLETERL